MVMVIRLVFISVIKPVKVIKQLIKLMGECFIEREAYHLNQASQLVMIRFMMVLRWMFNIMKMFNNLER